MNCMRCGRETSPGQVFCEDCRAAMVKYPVYPDTPVYLPTRKQAASVKKQTKKRVVAAEEQVIGLKKRLRFFIAWSLISTVLAAALAYPAIQYMLTDHFAVGQNYSSIVITEPAETAAD